MRTAWKILFVWGASLLIALAQTQSEEQVEFSAEEEHVLRPVQIPESAMALLAKDDMVRTIMDSEHVAKLPHTWFSASLVHLHAAGEADLLIMANPPLSGANTVHFWILRPAEGGYSIILNGPAHNLSIAKTRTNGYRDIGLWSATAIKVYTAQLRFDGKAYRLYSGKWEDIR